MPKYIIEREIPGAG